MCVHVYLLYVFVFASVISVHLCSHWELNRADTCTYCAGLLLSAGFLPLHGIDLNTAQKISQYITVYKKLMVVVL